MSGRLYYFNSHSFTKDMVTAYNISIDPFIKENNQEYVLRLSVESFCRLSKVLEYNQKKKMIFVSYLNIILMKKIIYFVEP